MYAIIVAIWMLANPSDNTSLTYVEKTYETLEACEADKARVEELLWVVLKTAYDVDKTTAAATLTCEQQ